MGIESQEQHYRSQEEDKEGRTPDRLRFKLSEVREREDRLREIREGREPGKKDYYMYDTVFDFLHSLAAINPKLTSRLFREVLTRNFDPKARTTIAENLPLLATNDPELAARLYEEIFEQEKSGELTESGLVGSSSVQWSAADSLRYLAVVDQELAKKFYKEAMNSDLALVRQQAEKAINTLAESEPEVAREIRDQ